jgi:hypothetical protein
LEVEVNLAEKARNLADRYQVPRSTLTRNLENASENFNVRNVVCSWR